MSPVEITFLLILLAIGLYVLCVDVLAFKPRKTFYKMSKDWVDNNAKKER